VDIEYYQVKVEGRRRAFHRDTLASFRVNARKIIREEDGSEREELVQTTLDTDDKIEQAMPGGEWIKVKFRENVTGADIDKARSLQWKNDGTGNMVEHPSMYPKSWVLTLLEDWTYDKDDYSLDARGLSKLPDEAVYILENRLIEWKDSLNPLALKTLTLP